jgi:hypothetical protein
MSSPHYVQLMYLAAVSLFYSIIPNQSDTFVQTWHKAVDTGFLHSEMFMNSHINFVFIMNGAQDGTNASVSKGIVLKNNDNQQNK